MTITQKINNLEIKSDLKDNESPVRPSLPSPVVTPLAPPPQLPHNNSTTMPLEPVITQKTTQGPIETRACTVRLEILTESDIIKHVHMHHKKDTLVETMETPKDTHYTRLSAKLKPNRTTCHPKTATKDVNYSSLGIEDSDHMSPTPKCQ